MVEQDLYRNRDFVPDFDALMEETAARSRDLASRAHLRRDLPYGDTPRQKLDIVSPSGVVSGAPIHMFIHGGYWRAGSKDIHTLVAGPVLEAGGIAAIIGYDLMPDTRLAEIVEQVRKAARFVADHAAEWGGDPARFTASGHSAGGHLASLLAARAPGDVTLPDLPPVRGLILVSGIYDLSGIPGSFLKDEARMRPDEAAAWSPLSALQLPCGPRVITRGEAETKPFHEQASALDALLKQGGHDSELRRETGSNHLSIVFNLADSAHPLGRRLLHMVAES